MNTYRRTLRVHPSDDLIVALTDLSAGEHIELDDQVVILRDNVRAKHKFTSRNVTKGAKLTMYGVTVGTARCDIAAGEVVTVANLSHSSSSYESGHTGYQWQAPNVEAWRDSTFDGILREDGQVGTANYWLVVPLVFCQNRNVEALRNALQDALGYGSENHYRQLAWNLASQYRTPGSSDAAVMERTETFPVDQRPFPNVDGVKFITHTAGCGGTRDDAQTLCKLLAGYIHHPNVAGATVLSLGCQNAQIHLLKEELHKLEPDGQTPVDYFEQQAYGSEQSMMEAAIRSIFDGLATANRCVRQPMPMSGLKVGVECGGSDGFSGLSANPLIGMVADRVVALGGSAILSEFPELCGVEQDILNRCTSDPLRQRFQALIQAYERHANAVGASFDMNPSPGNIRDGLITDAMKSAGAALKGGTAPIVDILDYPEVVVTAGLNLLCTPGNDVESTTALAAAGANLILFSTGMGTPTGNPIVPVLKVSSNSATAQRMADIIDFDAGPIISGEEPLDLLAEKLLSLCQETGSGRYVSKAQRLGQNDFIPWKRGVSL